MNCLGGLFDVPHIALIITMSLMEVADGRDPCYDSINLNNSDLTIDNTNVGTNNGFLVQEWYRITSSTEGLLVRTCPTGNECGTTSQVWMNDTIPSYSEGETKVEVCIRRGTTCCERRQRMTMKNCNHFVVYYLTNLPSNVGYCFDSSTKVLTTVMTTPSTTTTTTSKDTFSIEPNQSKDSDSIDKGTVIAVSVSVPIAAGGLAVTLAIVGRIIYMRNLRNRIGGTSNAHAPIVETISH